MSSNLISHVQSVPLNPVQVESLAPRMQTEAGRASAVVATLVDAYAGVMPKALQTPEAQERVKEAMLSSMRGNDRLMQAAINNRQSFANAMLLVMRLGLDLHPTLGHAYLIPYGSEVQLQLGYKGLVELARRSGQIARVYAELVHPGDAFTVRRGTSPNISHEPDYFAEGRTDDDAIGVYAVAVYADGSTDFEVLSRDEVEKRRAVSKAKNAGTWKSWWGEMAKKTAVKRLCKRLPMSVDAADALAADADNIDDSRPMHVDARPTRPARPVQQQPIPEQAHALPGPNDDGPEGP